MKLHLSNIMSALVLLFVAFVGCAGDKGHTGKEVEAEETKFAALQQTILSRSRIGSAIARKGDDMRTGAPRDAILEDGADGTSAAHTSRPAKEGPESMKYTAMATSQDDSKQGGKVDVNGANREPKSDPNNDESQAKKNFDYYDRNNDGVIPNMEYWKLSPRTAETHAAFDRMDKNSDGKLTKKEFGASPSKPSEAPKVESALGEDDKLPKKDDPEKDDIDQETKSTGTEAEHNFEYFDRNKDGKIPNMEYWKHSPRTAETHYEFDRMDKNDDGVLTKKEFRSDPASGSEDDIDQEKKSTERKPDADTNEEKKSTERKPDADTNEAEHNFEYFDRNKDGKIPNMEYWKRSPRTAETHYEFDRMDQNNDGVLTKKEFRSDPASGSEDDINQEKKNIEIKHDADTNEVAKRESTTSTTTAGLLDAVPGIEDVWSGTSSISVGWQWIIASSWIIFLCSIPLVLGRMSTKPPPRSEIALGVAMVVLLGGGIVIFTNYVHFQSYHFTEHRSLTLVECVYFMSQVITTVGYGDVTPANPTAQVFVGFYVIGALFVISILFSRLVDHLVMAVHEYGSRFRKPREEAMTEQEAIELASGAPKPLDLAQLGQAALVFFVIASVWVMFFYLWPGEGKTFNQCVYFAIITMSTVGFGAFTPVTEGGLVFAAFWMLFGSAALVNLISKFSCYVMCVKDWEQYDPRVARRALKELGSKSLDEAEFMRFCLLTQGLATKEDLEKLKRSFDGLGPTNGKIRFADLHTAVMNVAATE